MVDVGHLFFLFKNMQEARDSKGLHSPCRILSIYVECLFLLYYVRLCIM